MRVDNRVVAEATGGFNVLWRLAVILLAASAFRLDAAEPSKPRDSMRHKTAAKPDEPDNAAQDQTLNVVCLDKDGNPVAGAELHLFQSVAAEPTRYEHFGPFTSDAQGRVACPRAVVYDECGQFDRWAYARVPGRLVGVARSVNWKNRLPINAEFRVQMHASQSVEGLVTVPDGFDPTKVAVRVQVLHISTGPGQFEHQSFPRHLPFAGLDAALPEIFDKRPDAEGRIRFDDVPVQGSLYLVTVGAGLGEAQWRNENKVFDQPIRLALSKEGILGGRIESPDGQPAVGMRVAAQLSFNSQQPIYFLSTFHALTDAKGEFELHGLPQTPLALSVEDPSRQWLARPLERLSVAVGETEHIGISMEVGVTVSGGVFDADGQPVEGAAISALADTQGSPSLAHDMTDREGRYRLRLPSGRAKLYFNSLPNGFAYPEPQIIKRLDIEAGQEAVQGLDFTIRRAAGDGEPTSQGATIKSQAPPQAQKPNPALAGRVAAIAKSHAERERQFEIELREAKQDDKKVNDANQRYQAQTREQAEDLMHLIAEHAADAEAFDAVLVLVSEMRYPLDDSLTEIVLDHHLADADMGRLCFALRYRGGEAWAERILTAAADRHPQGDVRGQAAFALGDYYRNEAFPWGREAPEAKKAELLAAAGRRYQQTVDEFAEISTPDGKTTLGEKARHELNRLKNLPNLKIGRPAPPIAAAALDGKPMSLAEYRGQVVLLVFWGSWCGPCMKMVPHERELAERHRGKPFVLLGVNCGDTREAAQATMEQQQMTWRCWWDGEETRGPIETDYDVPHWPRVFVIDAEGIIRAIDPDAKELDRTIETLLEATAKP